MIIELKNIKVNFGERHLFKGVNLQIASNTFYLLAGSNSAGKTTFLKILGLQQKPTAGQILIDNQIVPYNNINTIAKLRRQIGFIFDEHKLLNDLSVFDNIALPLRIIGENERKIREKTYTMLDWADLRNKAHKMPTELSSSEQKLISVARNVIKRPKLILADDLLKDLDTNTASRFLLLLSELAKENTTIILSTHNQIWAAEQKHPLLVIKDQSIELTRG